MCPSMSMLLLVASSRESTPTRHSRQANDRPFAFPDLEWDFKIPRVQR